MNTKKRGLGKGLGALLTENENQLKEFNNHSIDLIKIDNITPNPDQPRIEFDKEKLNDLADSIKIHGIIQPITLRKIDNNKYQIISGERRYRASQIAGLTELPAYIREADDEKMLQMAIVENVQREDLNPIETAIGYQRLIEEFNLNQEQVGKIVGKSRATVTNMIRLLKLPDIVQIGLRNNELTTGHARALVAIENNQLLLEAYHYVVNNELSVRNTENLVKDFLNKDAKTTNTEKIKTKIEVDKKLIDEISQKLNSKVIITKNINGKGKITISYNNEDELNRIISHF